MKTINLYYLLVPLLLSMGACSLLGSEDPSPALIGDGTWKLVAFLAGGEEVTPPEDQPFAMGFNEDGNFGYQADCNLGSGSYEADVQGLIQLKFRAQTLKGCGADIYHAEFYQNLEKVDTYTIKNERLMLTATTDEPIAFTFERVDSLSHDDPSF